MIAVDTNILVYAHRAESQWHEVASERLDDLARGGASGASPWMIPMPCLHEFFAVATHPRMYSPATPVDQALAQIQAWLESPTLLVRGESDRHLATLFGLLAKGKVTGPGVHDVRVAAICIDHGVRELWSADRDFSRLPLLAAGLKVVNPLV